MSTPIDEETYGPRRRKKPEEIRNGNPGRPQSDYATEDPQVPPDRGTPREGYA